ncbi:MAG: NAD-dependent malic enzyme [Planctomycetota bacterium]|nr:NAD-dependent malic enzyme [Planctomycetota bacterium]
MQEYRPQIDPETGEKTLPVHTRGRDLVETALLNKGTAFTHRERVELELLGVLPPAVNTMEQQLDRVYENFSRKKDDLEKYVHLINLQDRNETLFYSLLLKHIEEMMPIVYTPVVGLACQQFSHIFRRPRGLYVTAENVDRVDELLLRGGSREIAVIVATDNEGILGLGDLGAGGMGIPIGKLSLYTAGAGIHPARCLPVSLDVGTNNAALLADPLYLGVREERLRGDAYFDLIDRFLKGVKKIHPGALVQFEDFSRQNAFTILDRYRNELLCFNDDIQGTGALVLAGVKASLRLRKEKLSEQKFVIDGAGAAGIGISRILTLGSMAEGVSEREAREKIWALDSQGLIIDDRPGLQEYKKPFARRRKDVEGWTPATPGRIELVDVVRYVMPDVLIGTSGQAGQFTEDVLRLMGEADERPLIFPLSNPTDKAECHPVAALRATGGRALVATGSPFGDVEYEGRTIPVAQGNNALIFPGLGLGAVVMGASRVTDGMLLAAARSLSTTLSEERLQEGALYPPVSRFREIAHRVAVQVAFQAGEDGVAESISKDEALRRVDAEMWAPEYLPYRAADGKGVQ